MQFFFRHVVPFSDRERKGISPSPLPVRTRETDDRTLFDRPLVIGKTRRVFVDRDPPDALPQQCHRTMWKVLPLPMNPSSFRVRPSGPMRKTTSIQTTPPAKTRVRIPPGKAKLTLSGVRSIRELRENLERKFAISLRAPPFHPGFRSDPVCFFVIRLSHANSIQWRETRLLESL